MLSMMHYLTSISYGGWIGIIYPMTAEPLRLLLQMQKRAAPSIRYMSMHPARAAMVQAACVADLQTAGFAL